MSLTEREKEIAEDALTDIFHRSGNNLYMEADVLLVQNGIDMLDRFISCIREEQEAVAWLHYQRSESDVITTYVKHVWGNVAVGSMAQYSIPLFTIPPAAPCDNGSKQACNCSELVEALKAIESIASPSSIEYLYAEKALANHAKRMKGEE